MHRYQPKSGKLVSIGKQEQSSTLLEELCRDKPTDLATMLLQASATVNKTLQETGRDHFSSHPCKPARNKLSTALPAP